MHSGKWGTKSYLESLHRTYQIPLPRMNDGSFERALQFREEEKNFYGRLQQENDQLRHRVTKLEGTLSSLEEHSNTLLQFYNESKTSSKPTVNDNIASTHKSSSSDSDVGGSKHSKDGSEGCGKGGADEVSREILSTELPNSSGSSIGHSGDGSKSGEGDESRGEETKSI